MSFRKGKKLSREASKQWSLNLNAGVSFQLREHRVKTNKWFTGPWGGSLESLSELGERREGRNGYLNQALFLFYKSLVWQENVYIRKK